LRRLSEDMTNRSVNRSVKENSANLHAFEIDANRLSRLKGSHVYPVRILGFAQLNCNTAIFKN